jgi:hypothetical protein
LLSSWFDISFMVSSFCSRPRSPGPFMKKRPPEAQTELSTDYPVTWCGPGVDRPDGFGQRTF